MEIETLMNEVTKTSWCVQFVKYWPKLIVPSYILKGPLFILKLSLVNALYGYIF